MSNKTKDIDLKKEKHEIAKRYMLLIHKLNDEKEWNLPLLVETYNMRVLKDFIKITMEQPKEVIELVMKYVDTAYQIGNMETKDIGYCVGYQKGKRESKKQFQNLKEFIEKTAKDLDFLIENIEKEDYE